MKKYVKPELFYENFELTQQIANCQFILNLGDETECGFTGEHKDWGTITYFAPENNCDYLPEEYCYHSSTNGVSIFYS